MGVFLLYNVNSPSNMACVHLIKQTNKNDKQSNESVICSRMQTKMNEKKIISMTIGKRQLLGSGYYFLL